MLVEEVGVAMILLNSILVATDFGPTSETALTYGRDLARSFGARLHVLHVVDATVMLAAGEFVPTSLSDVNAVVESARHQIDAVVAPEDRARLGVETVVRVSSAVAPTIVQYAREAHVDVIIVGTHGRQGASHLLMGSVAEKVVRTAPCPVLVVRPNEHEFVVPEPVGVAARI
jgi:universal stress protein A